PARFEKLDGILEMIGVDVPAQGLCRLERHTVARVEVSHLALAYHDERLLVDAVLPRIKPDVNAAAQEPGLEPRFAIARNDLTFLERTFAAPDFLDRSHLRVRDVNDPEQARQKEKKEDEKDRTAGPGQPRRIKSSKKC